MSPFSLPPPTTCPYCGSDVDYHPTSEAIYGTDYGAMWVCSSYPYCDTYISTHDDRTYDDGRHKPMGIMADVETRRWRLVAHAALDPLWKKTDMPRTHAYEIMAQLLEIPMDEAHIGLLSKAACKDLIWALMNQGPSLS